MSDKNRKYNVLFVDDERRILTALRSIFRREYNVFTADGGAEALEILKSQTIDVVVSDQRMPNMLGNELLAQVHQLYPQTMRVLLTGFMDKEAIIDTINQGQIYRFVNKPWKNEEIREIIAEAALASELEIESLNADIDDVEVTSEQLIPEQPASSVEPTVTANNISSVASNVEKMSGQKRTKPKIIRPSVMLVDDSENTITGLRSFCQRKGSTLYVTNDIHDAVAQLKKHEDIGVFILKLPIDSAETLQTISLLKQYRPEIITTVLATQTDAETIVELINTGQVFRYLSEPCDPLLLEMTIEQSFKHHSLLKKKATLKKRVKVDNRKMKFSDRIKSLFTIFSREEEAAR